MSEFHLGPVSLFRMRPDGQLRPETWRDRWKSGLADALSPRGSFIVTAIDRDAGVITVESRR